MKSIYLREQKRYAQDELRRILDCSESEFVRIIRKLKEFGILKAVKASSIQKDMSELVEQDIAIVDVEYEEDDYYYVFTFVGVIVVFGIVLKIYPKYILNNNSPLEEIKQVFRVLETINSKEQSIRLFNDSGENAAFNMLAVQLYLLQDYFENGIYSNTETVIESNGTGEILWDKTINETFALIKNNRPYYFNMLTKKRINNDYDYFKRLHECILTQVSNELGSAGILDLFGISGINLSDEELTDFGDEKYIEYRIEKELNIQFNTRKQMILYSLKAYIDQSGDLSDINSFSLYGTNSFNLVWEHVCAEILDNVLNTKLNEINQLPGETSDTELIKLIDKPKWTITGEYADDTLKPDIVSIWGKHFIISDAKYYVPRLEPNFKPMRQPGIESITKQYLYQLAFKKFIADHNFDSVDNIFIMPTENNVIIDKGEVSLEMLHDIELQNIKVRLLPAKKAFDLYLKGSKLDMQELLYPSSTD